PFDLAQHLPKLRAIAGRQSEGASDLAVTERGRTLADKAEQLGHRRQRTPRLPLPCRRLRGFHTKAKDRNRSAAISRTASSALRRIEVGASSPAARSRSFLPRPPSCLYRPFSRRAQWRRHSPLSFA